MSTNIGNLNATLSLSEWEFTNGLEQSAAAALEFAGKTEGAANRADKAIRGIGKGGGFNGTGAAMAIQQVGFGVQDFASQFETRGLAGGISAVTNNVQMLGAAFGPVGLAVTAVGGALAGILLPKLIESSGLFEDNTKKAKEWGSGLEKTFIMQKKIADFEAQALAGSTEDFDKKAAEAKREIEQHEKQLATLGEQLAIKNKIVEAEEKAKKLADSTSAMDTSLIPDWMNPVKMLETAAGPSKAKAEQAELLELQKKHLNEIQELKQRADMDGVLRPQVAQNEAMRRQQTLELKMLRENEDAERKAIEESAKLKQDLLEKYGTAAEKLAAKQAREMDEAAIKTNGDLVALDQLKAAQEVERKRLGISEKESDLKKLGKDPGMSAGLSLSSSEGISAINRFMQGTSQQSLDMQMLEVEKKQLALMEQQARGAEISSGEQKLLAGEQLEPVLGQAEVIAKLPPDIRQRRGAEFNKDSAEHLRVLKKLLKSNEDILKVSSRTTVRLSGS